MYKINLLFLHQVQEDQADRDPPDMTFLWPQIKLN